MRKPWTDNEVEYVLANRGRRKLEAIARHLGRSKASVVGMLVHYGHTRKKEPRKAWAAALRTMHKQGWSDARIAVRLGCSRETARRRRETLGLPPNPYQGLEARRRYRRQMDNADATNLIDLRWRPARVARLTGEGRG
jgi:hypothetical protein